MCSAHLSAVPERAGNRSTQTLDTLTGLCRVHSFVNALLDCVGATLLWRQPCSVFLCDIDHLRTWQTTGPRASDTVLQRFAHLLACTLPPGVALFRIGGDDFGILASETDHARAQSLAENLRAAVAAWDIPMGNGANIQITCTIGTATYPDDLALASGDDLPAEGRDDDDHGHRARLLWLADRALSAAKEAGGNAVCAAQALGW